MNSMIPTGAVQLRSQLRSLAHHCIRNSVGFHLARQWFRRALLEELLEVHGNNQVVIAEMIGMHRNTVGRFMRDHHLEPGKARRRGQEPRERRPH
jgi:DNA-binding protein Fis